MARSRDRGSKAARTAKPRTDVYTALLVVSLLAQVAGAVFLYLDWNGLKTSAAPRVSGDLPASAPAAPGNPQPAAP